MVIDTWKVDDNGDGDPRNDVNRIRPGVQAANGIRASMGSLSGGHSGAVATTIRPIVAVGWEDAERL